MKIQRGSPRKLRGALVFGILALLLLGAMVGGREIATLRASAAASSDNGCDRVPEAKCHPAPTTGRAVGPQPITPVPANWVSPTTISCGAGFFDSASASALDTQFGAIDCFRFQDRPTWIVVGTGMPTTGGGVAPGGTMIGTESCRPSDSSCLDANTARSFSDFMVSYPPKANSAPGELVSTFGNRLLYLSDAYCGFVIYDIDSGRWYPTGSINGLMGGAGANALNTPASVSGSFALAHGAPADTGGCQ